MRKYNAASPKQGSKRFNYILKTISIADLGIIYLWLGRTNYLNTILIFFNRLCIHKETSTVPGSKMGSK